MKKKTLFCQYYNLNSSSERQEANHYGISGTLIDFNVNLFHCPLSFSPYLSVENNS